MTASGTRRLKSSDTRSIGVNLGITMYNRSFLAEVRDVGDRCVLRGRVKRGRILFPVHLLLLLLFWVRSTTSMAFEGGDHSQIPLPSSFCSHPSISWTTSVRSSFGIPSLPSASKVFIQFSSTILFTKIKFN